ncbi:MAG: hypothetical protein GY754_24025 [bacterium]|nr:hypothetical protein [bacterium]
MNTLKKMLYFDEKVIFSYYAVMIITLAFHFPEFKLNQEALDKLDISELVWNLIGSFVLLLPFFAGLYYSIKHIFSHKEKTNWEVNYMAISTGLLLMLVGTIVFFMELGQIVEGHWNGLSLIMQLLAIAFLFTAAYDATCGFLLWFLTAVWSNSSGDGEGTEEFTNPFFDYRVDMSNFEVIQTLMIIGLFTGLLKHYTNLGPLDIMDITLFYCLTLHRFVLRIFFRVENSLK